MSKYQKLNNLFGWITFLIACFTYFSTIEPTASFWDCGEYIATAFKLQVGHPPGAPFFQILGRFLSLFAFGDVTQAAKMINILSALSSAFTILFLFWSITAIALKLSAKYGELNDARIYTIISCGLVGALAYAFSDSFWFSAVEGEVYAMSSFFTAVVFWAILKWERVADEAHADRWIILIAYLMGLSIGVHLLNLLAIPAIVFVYYFKKYQVTRKGFLTTALLSVVLLGGVQSLIIPGIIKLAARFELFFVNSLGMPFNSGTIIYSLIVVGGISWGLWYTHKKEKPLLNTIILCFTMLVIGYSSFAMLVIRSNARTPLNENDPKNAINLLSYLNREQYGDWPILYGQYYNAPLDPQEPYKDGTPVYVKDEKEGKYIVSDDRKSSIPNYDPRFCTPFPRMWSQQSNHEGAYKKWGNVKGEKIQVMNYRGESETLVKPTFVENLTYFFSYQVGWMYLRYFMWNFAGRQNDIQGHGNITEGNWITGISFIDEMRLGAADNVPSNQKNKARNLLFALPLILGIIGLSFHFDKDSRDAFVVLLLFFFTGLAIVFYLNQYPYQPRERDYAYAASFYAFAIWIGIGVFAVAEWFRKKLSDKLSGILAGLLCLIAVPGIMAKEEWNDHDRSKRYTARDFAINYLNSCAPNAILFTNGDNDTFPLWYVQEVEGYRTDVRVVNLSLLNTDWYIDQMKRKAYDSDPVPFSLTNEKYRQGTRDYVPFYDRKLSGYIKIRELMDFVASDEPNNKIQMQSGKSLNYFPTNKMSVPVDREKVLRNGTVEMADSSKIVSSIDWTINKSYVTKNDLMVLDLLATNNWDRPIYFAVTTGPDSYLGLEPYFQLEGLAYRLVPIKSNPQEEPQGVHVATKPMYENIMKRFQWGGIERPDNIYLDENILRMTTNLRIQMATLATALIEKGEKEKALEVLKRCMEVMPEHNVPYDATMYSVAIAYYQAGETEIPNQISRKLFDLFETDLRYYYSLKGEKAASLSREIRQAEDILQRLTYVCRNFKQESLAKEFEGRLSQVRGGSPMPK